MTQSEILAGLNEEQRRAVEAVRGPVCILAGAGSGKTTTITRRIANQVATGTFAPAQILPVTFTDKAASEMRSRLAALGVAGVRARTFHAAGLAQLRFLAAEPPRQILPSKVLALRQIANSLPKPYKFRPAIDLASEIEWAKNRRIDTASYASSLNGHEPPIPVDLMARVYRRYEHGKQERGLIDFEDLLELAIQLFQTDEAAREQFAHRYHAFTVDEYQDVNLLQETLLRAWVGERDDICVVGDDYQSIYGFTGATPDYLLDMPRRYFRTTVVRLESNYRSTPQILEIANRLVPRLGGEEKVLRATRGDGPKPSLQMFSEGEREISFIVNRIHSLREAGVALEDIAILYRVNFRSEDYEEALTAQNVPYQVRDGAFLNRVTARQLLKMLSRSRAADLVAQVRKIADRQGYLEELPDGLGEQELTRQNDLARFIRLAEELDDGQRTGAEFVEQLQARFGAGEGRGVNLLTYHRAKGLEFEVVFLPRLEDGELPFKRSRSPEALAEERRLFYVGITRAKTHLAITWVNAGRRKGSPFVGELTPQHRPARAPDVTIAAPIPGDVIVAAMGEHVEVTGGFRGPIVDITDDGVMLELDGGTALFVPFGERVAAGGKTRPLARPSSAGTDSLLHELKAWRLQRARADGVPAYVVFHDSTLQDIAARAPTTMQDLARVAGVGPAKLERYGRDIIALLAKAAG